MRTKDSIKNEKIRSQTRRNSNPENLYQLSMREEKTKGKHRQKAPRKFIIIFTDFIVSYFQFNLNHVAFFRPWFFFSLLFINSTCFLSIWFPNSFSKIFPSKQKLFNFTLLCLTFFFFTLTSTEIHVLRNNKQINKVQSLQTIN